MAALPDWKNRLVIDTDLALLYAGFGQNAPSKWKARAEELAGVVNEYEIARPTADTEKMLKISGLDKGTPNKIFIEEV